MAKGGSNDDPLGDRLYKQSGGTVRPASRLVAIGGANSFDSRGRWFVLGVSRGLESSFHCCLGCWLGESRKDVVHTHADIRTKRIGVKRRLAG